MRTIRPEWLRKLWCPRRLGALRRRLDGSRPRFSPGDTNLLLTAIVEHLPAMVFAKDVADDLRFVLFNREGEELLGISRHELLGRTDHELFPAEQADFFVAKDREVLGGGTPLEIPEEDILSPVRGPRLLRTLKFPVSDERGRQRYLAGVSQDVTDLRNAEHRRRQAEATVAKREAHYRSLLENSSDLVVLLDASAIISYVSPSTERVLGHPLGDLQGTTALAFVHPADQKIARDAFESVLEDHTSHPRLNLRLRDRKGEWRTLECVATNALANPAVAGVVVNGRDITERVELERQYLHAQRMEAVGNLAGGVAHDFNNLLSVVALNAAMLLDGLDSEDPARADVLAILAAAESASNLTRQLLAFSRRQVLQPVLLDVAVTLHDMEPLIRRVLGEDVQLQTVFPEDRRPATVFVDRGQLEQVLLNLSVNARQAMPNGGKVTIGVSSDADEVRLEVADTGLGMPEETRSHIFEPFFTTKPTGTGLGLATVQGIVSQSRGRITVESEPGHGTVFRVVLPRAKGSLGPTRAPRPAHVPRARPGETILVVDDEPQVAAAVRKLLSRLGYEVLLAADGEEALAAVRSGTRVDLVLTDVVMPRMRGPELAAHLEAIRPGLPVILTTGYDDADEGVELTHAGRLLTKPFALDSLARAVRQALDAPSASEGERE